MAAGECKRIGVLMVHGIGTNPPNQFLVAESRKLVAAMSEEAEAITVLAEPPVAKSVPDKFEVNYTANVVRVHVKLKSAEELMIDFNEVYWADLGEKPTLVNQIKFWFWALSMWSVAARNNPTLEGAKRGTYIPMKGSIRPWERLLLVWYGILFLLGALTIGLYNVIADRVKLPRVLISDILTAYLGDVMLYSQPGDGDDPQVGDYSLPPRVGIRARMIDALVEYALRDYDRWYLFAHSQGTVVAYNGLMEISAALPNYLSRNRWNTVRNSYLGLRGNPPVPASDLSPMMPRRPVWLEADDGIDRKALFAKLRGFLTYGSAIGKFRGIWPVIVPANTDEFVFNKEFFWINAYDWTDPVSGPLLVFTRTEGTDADGRQNKQRDEKTGAFKKPIAKAGGYVDAKIDYNISYRSGWVWLLSHLQYLNYSSRAYERPNLRLGAEAGAWLLGQQPKWDALAKDKPSSFWRNALGYAEVLIATAAVWLSTAGLLWWLVDDKHKDAWLGWMQSPYLPQIAVVSVIVAAIADRSGALMRRRGEDHISRGMRLFVVTVGIAAILLITLCASSWIPALVAGALILAFTIELIVALRRARWAAAVKAGIAVMVFMALGAVILVPALANELSVCLTSALQWLYSLPGVGHYIQEFAGWLQGLFSHAGARRMAQGLLSLAFLLVVILGGLRWLLQDIPVKK